MGYSEHDLIEQGPYGAVIPAGGLPPEYAAAYADPEPEPAEGLPADVVASLELPGPPERPRYADAVEAIAPKVPAAPVRDLVEGFRLELPRGGWVQFGSILDVSGGLRKQIITQIGVLTQRIQAGKATAQEQVAVDNEITAKLLSAIIETWSYDAPLPVTPRTLDQLPGVVVDQISAVAAEYMKMLVSKTGGNQGSEKDPQSPQRPSAG